MARRLYLHIGTMKAATSYLQSLFDGNVDLLARHGILWQGSRFNQDSIHDFQKSGMLSPSAKGSWSRLRDGINSAPGDVLVSMELMARMPPRRVERLISALSADEVVVILTARDLSRGAPSHWQETTQNQGTTPWAEWIEKVTAADPAADPLDPPFWRHHFLPGIVETWSAVASPGQLHLVTIPQSGGDSDAVWRRFASVLGVPADLAAPPRFNNASLGGHSAELMRRLNLAMTDVPFPKYRWGFKAALAKQTLARRAALEPRPALSSEQHARLRSIAIDMVEQLGDAKVNVVGDLAELVPQEQPPGPPYDPGEATDAELLAAAMDGLLGMGRRIGKLHAQRDELAARLAAAGAPPRAATGQGGLRKRLPAGVTRRLARLRESVPRRR